MTEILGCVFQAELGNGHVEHQCGPWRKSLFQQLDSAGNNFSSAERKIPNTGPSDHTEQMERERGCKEIDNGITLFNGNLLLMVSSTLPPVKAVVILAVKKCHR
jgi:hypothetical protein